MVNLNGVNTIVANKQEVDTRRKQMQADLVSCIMGNVSSVHSLATMGKRFWNVTGEVLVKRLLKGLFVFILLSEAEVRCVLMEGKMSWGNLCLLANVWHPQAGCKGYGSKDEGKWIRVFGVPVHLWGSPIFRAIGNHGRGFIRSAPAAPDSLEWVRLLVSDVGQVLESVMISNGDQRFECAVWEKLPPSLAPIIFGSKGVSRGCLWHKNHFLSVLDPSPNIGKNLKHSSTVTAGKGYVSIKGHNRKGDKKKVGNNLEECWVDSEMMEQDWKVVKCKRRRKKGKKS